MLKAFGRDQLTSLGVSYVFDELAPQTPYGWDKKMEITMFESSQKEDLLIELDLLEKMYTFYLNNISGFKDLEDVIGRFKEIRGIIKKVHNESDILSDVEFFELKVFSIDCTKLKNLIEFFGICVKSFIMEDMSDIVVLLNPEGMINRSFYVYDSYSVNLKKIRNDKKVIEAQIENSSDIRNELFEKRALILNMERAEESIIREDLTIKLKECLNVFENNIEFISELDFILAKVILINKFGGIKPCITKSDVIQAKGAYNPYYEKYIQKKAHTFTPINIEISKGANVVTGANMGGKSVALSTITLNVILAMCGFYVFAKEFRLPILDFIVFISDDLQSVKKGLSTFGAEVVGISYLIEQMKTKVGFAAIDEFARGTNPKEGEALVRGFLEYANRYNSFILASTHYSNVTQKGMAHFQVVGLKNADFDKLKSELEVSRGGSFDLIQDFMDYNIEKVSWDSLPPQDAMKVARLLGLGDEILYLAQQKEPSCYGGGENNHNSKHEE